ncbi:laminin-like protein epi-1, partial [Plakobranchus ocellatus]
VSKLIRENEQKEAEIFALKCQVDGEKKIEDNEKDEQIVQLTEKLGRNEKERFVDREALCKAQEELSDLNEKYLDLQHEMAEQKARYDQYMLGMYKKGQEAARFEREQELDYLLANAKNAKKVGVSLTELSRKLSRTEVELARWQALRLSETYNSPHSEPPTTDQVPVLKIRNNHHSLLDPTAASEADVTLAFVRDAFFHLLTDPVDREQHVRALLKIFAYPETHLQRIKVGLEAFKNIKIKKVFVDAK